MAALEDVAPTVAWVSAALTYDCSPATYEKAKVAIQFVYGRGMVKNDPGGGIAVFAKRVRQWIEALKTDADATLAGMS